MLDIIPVNLGFFEYKKFLKHSIFETCSIEKGFLRNFAKVTGKYLCRSLFFNKVAGLTSATFLKKSLRQRSFPVHLVKCLIAPYLQNTFGRMLLTGD